MTQIESTASAVLAGTAFTLGKMSEGRIMALASASPADSTDPVDEAVKSALHTGYPQIQDPYVDKTDTDPATPERKYGLTRVRSFPMGDGTTKDLVVMRGDIDAISSKAKLRRESNSILKANARVAIRKGWRPLAVATAEVGPDDKVGPFTLQGFVSITPASGHHVSAEDISSGPAIWARVNVWSPSLRIQHWANVVLIFILSVTGFYILDPFFGPTEYSGEKTGFLMGWMRFIHFAAGFAWLVEGLTRIWSAFTSRDRYLRWSAMWPLKSKEDFRNLGRTLQHYSFVKTESPMYLGHNVLQQLTYTAVYGLCFLQMLIGFILFGLYHQTNPVWAFFAIPTHYAGVAHFRMVHVLIMFLLWGFVIGHVYLIFRADSVERHGGLSAMINGAVWVKRGTKPVDGPAIE